MGRGRKEGEGGKEGGRRERRRKRGGEGREIGKRRGKVREEEVLEWVDNNTSDGTAVQFVVTTPHTHFFSGFERSSQLLSDPQSPRWSSRPPSSVYHPPQL